MCLRVLYNKNNNNNNNNNNNKCNHPDEIQRFGKQKKSAQIKKARLTECK
jgi:hypothetical protein